MWLSGGIGGCPPWGLQGAEPPGGLRGRSPLVRLRIWEAVTVYISFNLNKQTPRVK